MTQNIISISEFCEFILTGMKADFAVANMTVTQTTVYDEFPVSYETIDRVLLEVKTRSRSK